MSQSSADSYRGGHRPRDSRQAGSFRSYVLFAVLMLCRPFGMRNPKFNEAYPAPNGEPAHSNGQEASEVAGMPTVNHDSGTFVSLWVSRQRTVPFREPLRVRPTPVAELRAGHRV